MPYNSTLKAALQAAIKTPADPKISGTILQQQLLAMVNAMEAGAVFMGTATQATSPTGEANCFYFATTQGTYTNFLDASGNPITLSAGESAFLSSTYQGKNLRWVKASMPLPHIDQTTGNWFVGNVDTGVKAQGPQGEDGTVGQDAVNPFKGWWPDAATLKAAVTATQGDFAYVLPAVNTDPVEIWEYDSNDDGTNNYWHDSGREFNPDYEQDFETGEHVNEVPIDDTHLDNPADGSLAKAEDVAPLKEKLTNQFVDVDNSHFYKNGTIGSSGSYTSNTAAKIYRYAVKKGQTLVFYCSDGSTAHAALSYSQQADPLSFTMIMMYITNGHYYSYTATSDGYLFVLLIQKRI